MSLPTRNNPYSFKEWLEKKKVNFFTVDEFLQKCMRQYFKEDIDTVSTKLEEFAEAVSFRWGSLAEECARPENRPYMIHYDAYHNRIDRIVRPNEMKLLEQEIFSTGLYSKRTDDWERFIKMLLLNENGEFGVMCPELCTEGLIHAIEELGESKIRPRELDRILQHCSEGINGEYGIGAQFLSEIQGGSDVPANLLEAEFDRGNWRLYGDKFFCSALHADYFVVTAKPQGSEKVAMFVVPAWLPGDKEKEIRNGYIIDRLKWKMGTVELPTGEVTFKGAVAYPLGQLDRGVANVVGIVLSYSRLGVGATCAGSMVRAVRDAKIYADFREAFGRKINQFPLLANQIDIMEAHTQRAVAGAFKLFDLFLKSGGRFSTKSDPAETQEQKKLRFLVRELVLLAKMYTSKISTEVIHDAMAVFGGHGVMEDFTVLPRLYRDSNINELWEGPRNVLLTQIHKDFRRYSQLYSTEEFVQDCLGGTDANTIKQLTDRMARLLAHPNLETYGAETLKAAAEWERFADDFMLAFQEQARQEVLANQK